MKKEFWGLEGAKDRYGNDARYKDGNNLYRPVITAEKPGYETSQPKVWKTKPTSEDDKGCEKWSKAK